jgi:hypothetical protein
VSKHHEKNPTKRVGLEEIVHLTSYVVAFLCSVSEGERSLFVLLILVAKSGNNVHLQALHRMANSLLFRLTIFRE